MPTSTPKFELVNDFLPMPITLFSTKSVTDGNIKNNGRISDANVWCFERFGLVSSFIDVVNFVIPQGRSDILPIAQTRTRCDALQKRAFTVFEREIAVIHPQTKGNRLEISDFIGFYLGFTFVKKLELMQFWFKTKV